MVEQSFVCSELLEQLCRTYSTSRQAFFEQYPGETKVKSFRFDQKSRDRADQRFIPANNLDQRVCLCLHRCRTKVDSSKTRETLSRPETNRQQTREQRSKHADVNQCQDCGCCHRHQSSFHLVCKNYGLCFVREGRVEVWGFLQEIRPLTMKLDQILCLCLIISLVVLSNAALPMSQPRENV